MKYRSTRETSCKDAVSLVTAMRNGLAADGGLYVPARLPTLTVDAFENLTDLPTIAERLLRPFFKGSALQTELGAICEAVFDFPVPLVPAYAGREDGPLALELYHGPTAAFKDFGARFLATCLDRAGARKKTVPLTILVATSGDTGGAVGCAFEHAKNARVVILYPKGRVSPLQEKQLTCWGPNVTSLRVAGDFDACQRLVKGAFADPDLAARHNLGSANSINIGRLLPQMSYYAYAALEVFRTTGDAASFIIPTGNLGNALACLWVRAMGLPIDRIVLAQNANRSLVDYCAGGTFSPRPSIATLANAMDVGNPSNFERLGALPTKAQHNISAHVALDSDIIWQISRDAKRYGRVWCPHSATAAFAWHQLPTHERLRPYVLVSTAHPQKFEETVAPLIDAPLPHAPALDALANRPCRYADIEARPDAFAAALEGFNPE